MADDRACLLTLEVWMNGSSWARWSPLSGIVFVAAYILGMVLTKAPDSSDPAETIAAYYPDHKGHRVQMIIAAYVLIGAALLFLWFVSGLRSRLRAAEGGTGTLSALAFAAGILFVGLLSVGALALAAPPSSMSFGQSSVSPGADVVVTVQSLGWEAILIGGMLAAAVMIFTTSILTLRTHLLPAWTAWVGFLAAIALLFAAVWIPQIALLIWMLVVSGAMLARPGAAMQAAPAPTP